MYSIEALEETEGGGSCFGVTREREKTFARDCEPDKTEKKRVVTNR